MKCPHCRIEFHPQMKETSLGYIGKVNKLDAIWTALHQECPKCNGSIVILSAKNEYEYAVMQRYFAYPKKIATRDPAPPEVPQAIANDYNEACEVFAASPKASAALSRRCLQHILSERGVSTKRDLNDAIEDALNSRLPSHIANDLDTIRVIGNFAAHPQKSKNTGEILPVEPEEAERNLDVLELLFDFYYVQPAAAKAKRNKVNEKLKDAGKPALKEPTT